MVKNRGFVCGSSTTLNIYNATNMKSHTHSLYCEHNFIQLKGRTRQKVKSFSKCFNTISILYDHNQQTKDNIQM